ncbi:MAG: DNA-binding protein [Bacteroidetes bacterium]|nr:MAG: DNA-binding protein [Bacteroidota bacterium]
MKDKVFIDTNIIIYGYSVTEPKKQKVAEKIVQSGTVFISTQVIQEISNVLSKKFKLNWTEIIMAISEISASYSVVVNTPDSIIGACKIANRYKYSFYDSLIIASALKSNCKILYTEDLQHNQLIENKLRIINPFKISLP